MGADIERSAHRETMEALELNEATASLCEYQMRWIERGLHIHVIIVELNEVFEGAE